MSFLTINGKAAPVKLDSVKRDWIEVGERGVAFDGTPYMSIRRRRLKMSLKLTPMSAADAAGWRNMFAGSGEDYDASLDVARQGWTFQGTAPTAWNAGNYVTGSVLVCPSGSGVMVQWPWLRPPNTGAPSDFTIFVVRGIHASTRHSYLLKRGLGESPSLYYLDGVATSWASVPAWLVYDATYIAIHGDAGNSTDVLYCGMWPSQDWGTVYTPTYLPTVKPSVSVAGDALAGLLADGVTPMVCRPRVTGETPVQRNGAIWTELDVELEEI